MIKIYGVRFRPHEKHSAIPCRVFFVISFFPKISRFQKTEKEADILGGRIYLPCIFCCRSILKVCSTTGRATAKEQTSAMGWLISTPCRPMNRGRMSSSGTKNNPRCAAARRLACTGRRMACIAMLLSMITAPKG